MYTPHSFRFKDQQEMVAFMQQYSFATIVTGKRDIPIATQVPFTITEGSGKLILSSHFAKANEQAKYIAENTSLIIFNEPHAYISPAHYEKVENVPTWDYMAVHAYGKAKIITDENAVSHLLKQMITAFDASYLKQWNSLPDKYKSGMIRGIVAFEIEVTDLQGQKKLSQNRTEAERQRIVTNLENSGNTVEADLAKHIKAL
jgi:transcriptional regulator